MYLTIENLEIVNGNLGHLKFEKLKHLRIKQIKQGNPQHPSTTRIGAICLARNIALKFFFRKLASRTRSPIGAARRRSEEGGESTEVMGSNAAGPDITWAEFRVMWGQNGSRWSLNRACVAHFVLILEVVGCVFAVICVRVLLGCVLVCGCLLSVCVFFVFGSTMFALSLLCA